MHVQVRYFAAAREAVRLPDEDLELPAGASVGEAVAALVRRHPALGPLVPRARVAVDERFADPEERLADGAVLALIPPVGGG